MLSLPGVNEIVELSFYPLGGNCPESGRDAECEGDKYQACVLDTQCSGVSCDASQQLGLAQFLYCFEVEHNLAMDAADDCSSAAGFDVSAVRGCFDDDSATAAALTEVNKGAREALETMQCYPWVMLDGEVLSTQPDAACLGQDASTYPLLDDICRAADEREVTAPAACSGHAAI